MRLKEISNVLNILVASPLCSESFVVSLVPKQRVQSELSDSVQAVFGLQDEQLMEAVSDIARHLTSFGADQPRHRSRRGSRQ